MNSRDTILNVSRDLPIGSSVLLPTSCAAPTGPSNVDGRCIMEGSRLPSSSRGGNSLTPSDHGQGTKRRRVAYPVYVLNNAPYTSGNVAGSNYKYVELVL